MVSQIILVSCLLVVLVPCVISATRSSNYGREKKLNVALEVRELHVPKRSLKVSLKVLAKHENRIKGTPKSQSSGHQSGRGKRGCNLLTCSVHDLAYRISQFSNKMNYAPQNKISACGYGRRRRHSV